MANETIKSKQYGDVVYTHIATMVFSPKPVPGRSDEEAEGVVERIVAWAGKYHPKRFFGSYMVKTTRPDLPEHSNQPWKSQQAHPYELFVPTHRDNENWAKDNQGCEYFTGYGGSIKGIKSLPIGVNDDDVQKWIEATKQMQMIIKEHF